MALAAIMERLTRRSPVTVMVRQTLQHAVSSQWIDELFEEQREKQYTRELLFSTVVDLMGLVALGLRPSLHAAAQSDPDLPVSLAALHDKVNRTEPQVVRALVQGSAERLLPVVQPMKKRTPWAAGYQVRVLDGNFRGAALPGQSLVVYAPELGWVVDVLPEEDAHAQERALMGPVLEREPPRRNPSTRNLNGNTAGPSSRPPVSAHIPETLGLLVRRAMRAWSAAEP